MLTPIKPMLFDIISSVPKEHFEISNGRVTDWLVRSREEFPCLNLLYARARMCETQMVFASKWIYSGVQSSFRPRVVELCALRSRKSRRHMRTRARPHEHERDPWRRANDVSCNKTGETAGKTAVTSCTVGTDVTRIRNGNTLHRQQLSLLSVNAKMETRFRRDASAEYFAKCRTNCARFEKNLLKFCCGWNTHRTRIYIHRHTHTRAHSFQ